MRKRLTDLFIPHKGNNFRPNFLERISIGIMLVLILLSFAIANMHAFLWIGSDWLVSAILPSVIVDLTNDERLDASRPILTRNSLLDDAATRKAEDMAEKEYFAHYSPEGLSPWHWFDQVSYDYLHAGENLAVHFTDSGDVMDAWMNSSLHHANIMNNDYREIGVGTAVGTYQGQPTVYVVQLFGTRREPVSAVVAVGEISEKYIETDTPEASRAVAETLPLEGATPSATVLSFYSDVATTSREGTPIAAMQSSGTTPSGVFMPLRAVTEPSMWLTALYGLLASIVVLALMLSIRLRWRSHHPLQVAYAGGLLVIMALLLYIHTSLTGMVTIV